MNDTAPYRPTREQVDMLRTELRPAPAVLWSCACGHDETEDMDNCTECGAESDMWDSEEDQ